ncbi:MAG TPA: DUF1778 domain-containing protein [Chlorobaculum sp.]|nr:DUF1778 domain-containing protein [Chlorobaculum sp.]
MISSRLSVYSGNLPYKTNELTMSTTLKRKGKNETASRKSVAIETHISGTKNLTANNPGSTKDIKPDARISTKQKSEGKARLEARMTQKVHAQIKRAAEIQGRTVTDFVVYAALEAATKAIEESSVIQLSIEGQKAFAEALLNPPEPNAALRRAFESHAALFGQNK